MSRSPTFHYPVDTETLLLLAWFSSQDIRSVLTQLKQEQSWKHPSYLLEGVLQLRLDEALTCLQSDPLCGPVMVHLVRYRIALVDLSFIASAIHLEEVVEPSNALFFSDQPFRSSVRNAHDASGPVNETEAFSESMTSHPLFAEHMEQWSQSWGGNMCRGAHCLQAFFTAYPRLALSLLDAPFFVRELLCMSLAQIDWHSVAAALLGGVPSSACECASRMHHCQEIATDPVAQGALLEEALRQAGCTIERLVPGLQDSQRDQALFLADLCKRTVETMARTDLLCR